MVVLGRSVAGVSGYSSDKEGAKDATFLPEINKMLTSTKMRAFEW